MQTLYMPPWQNFKNAECHNYYPLCCMQLLEHVHMKPSMTSLGG